MEVAEEVDEDEEREREREEGMVVSERLGRWRRRCEGIFFMCGVVCEKRGTYQNILDAV